VHSLLAPVLATALLVGAAAFALSPASAPGPAAAVATAADDAAIAGSTRTARYVWPTGTPGPALRPFDPPDRPWQSGHRGVDLDLATGAAVLAAGDGVVAFAGTVAGRGVVSIDHADGIRTTYEPVTAVVAAGERVGAGQVIGYLAGTAHCAPASCLHWGARRGPEAYVDPMLLLRAVVIRLYPDG
jgi:murein DD-endopeptidase MepM/ murein hydrolase activator NlpD